MNEELRALYEADQADRRDLNGAPSLDWSIPIERDRARRQRARELISTGTCTDNEDWLHAAMIFQHGETLDDYLQAQALATEAAARGHRRGPWLAAAAEDRWLMKQGRPQKYGTQYIVKAGRWRLWEVDPATTDAERTAAGVPPLRELQARAEELTRRSPPPPSQIPSLAGRLGGLELADLQVVVIPTPDAPAPPAAELADADGQPVPTPALPEGLRVRQRGIGWCAVDHQDEIVLFWDRLRLPADSPFVYGWRWPPELLRLDSVDVGNRAGVLISGAGDASCGRSCATSQGSY